MGIPVTVTIDDYLPFYNYANTSLLYAKEGPDKSLWMPILEKAAAKLFGNYEFLEGGVIGPAVQALTGAPFYDVDNSAMGEDELWDFIDKHYREGDMMSCSSFVGTGSDRDTNDIGVPYRHAFTINGTVKLGDGTKLVRIRNPWGSEYYKGPWSDQSDKWT